MKPSIALLHGPNLNRIEQREVEHYGQIKLSCIIEKFQALGKKYDIETKDYQSNYEGALIEQLWKWKDEGVKGIILNPGGLAHTSVALRDAICGIGITCVEVHLSNVHARESFRQTLLSGGACKAVLSGLGLLGYISAFHYLQEAIELQKEGAAKVPSCEGLL